MEDNLIKLQEELERKYEELKNNNLEISLDSFDDILNKTNDNIEKIILLGELIKAILFDLGEPLLAYEFAKKLENIYKKLNDKQMLDVLPELISVYASFLQLYAEFIEYEMEENQNIKPQDILDSEDIEIIEYAYSKFLEQTNILIERLNKNFDEGLFIISLYELLNGLVNASKLLTFNIKAPEESFPLLLVLIKIAKEVLKFKNIVNEQVISKYIEEDIFTPEAYKSINMINSLYKELEMIVNEFEKTFGIL